MRVVVVFWILLLIVFRLQFSFLGFLDFKYKPSQTLDVKVVNQYKKKNYFVLKIKNETLTFYTTSKENLKNLLNENISLTILTKNVGFWGYLTTFYAFSYNMKLKPISFLEEKIEKQHQSIKISNLFKALFLGSSIDFDTRKQLAALGVSHLFALSGLHLGFISFILFMIISPVYRFFHKKFPYRNKLVDIGIVVLIMEFLYLKFTSFPPSLIRAYVLEVVVFFFFFTLRDILNIKILIYTFFIAFFVFFTKIFSIGFLLSMVGVYYIYLFFNYYKANLYTSFLLSFYMFLVMFIWGHCFFGYMNNYQLLSPIINILFSVFYPLEVVLHFLGLGGIFDGIILKYLSFGGKYYYVNISLWFLIFFILLSFIAIKKKWAFYGINLLAFIILISSVKI